MNSNIDWRNIKLIIFDVDGTLYNQSKLRYKVAFSLFKYYLIRPAKYKELFILYQFRKEREKKLGYCSENLEMEQYVWSAGKLGKKVEDIIPVIDYWILKFPLKYLFNCRYEGVDNFFIFLEKQKIKTAVYSDYPAKEKLEAMQLKVDMIVTSIDTNINCFKPQAKAIHYICNTFNFLKEECVFIGDRYSRDGKCAENAGIKFIIIPDKKNNFFTTLKQSIEHRI